MIYGNVELYNVHELLDGDPGEGKIFTRIPDELRLKLNQSAQNNALQTTGSEARFNLESETAKIVLQSTERPSIVEVYQGCFLTGWQLIGLEPTEVIITRPGNMEELIGLSKEYALPFDASLTRVILPWRPPARLLGIDGDFELPRPGQTPLKKLLMYGSSITHGNSTLRPTGSYAMRTAQLLGVDLINLGFGGGAHLEREIADYIAGRTDWDMATLELGINVIGSIDVAEFAHRVDYLVTTIASAHPDQWIFCMDLFLCRYDLARDPKIKAFRKVVQDKVASLDMPKLEYVPGDAILTSVCGLAADLVHPSPYGFEEIARNLSKRIREKAGL